METFTYHAGHAFNRDVDPGHYDGPARASPSTARWPFFSEHLRAG
jgi:hypothetical protein